MPDKTENFSIKLLRWFCRPEYLPNIEGDLVELYNRRRETLGPKKANRLLFKEVLLLFRPGIIRPLVDFRKYRYWYLLQQNLILSFRNFNRFRTHFIINLLGFSLGLGIALALFLIVRFERSFDNYHESHDRIFQIMGMKTGDNGTQIPSGIITTLNEQFPEVEQAVTVHNLDPQFIRVDAQKRKMEGVFFVHPEIFDLLDIEWLIGTAQNSLNRPDQVVIDQPTAERLFQGEDPIGKSIEFENDFTAIVSGIIAEVPANSEFPMKMIFPMTAHPWHWVDPRDDWGGGDSAYKGLVKLQSVEDQRNVEERISEIGRTHEMYYEHLALLPITAVHTNPDNDPFNYYTPSWLINWLLYVAIFILIISCVNFINLSTAQAIAREKGIAIRKMLGSNRLGLLFQFLTETAVLVYLSILLAYFITWLIIQHANQFFNTTIPLIILESWDFVLLAMALGAVVTLVAGIYPALMVGGFGISTLFRPNTSSKASVALRQTLITTQFVIAQVMIVAILVGYQQLQYLNKKDPGFRYDNVVMVDIPERNQANRDLLQQQLLARPSVKEISFALSSPQYQSSWWDEFDHPRFASKQVIRLQFIDETYLDFYGMELVAGRNFLPSDSTQNMIIVNEMIGRAMGYDDLNDAIGEAIIGYGSEKMEIVGVVRNFHSENLRDKMVPHLFLYRPYRFYRANIRIDQNAKWETLQVIETEWNKIFPNHLFEYEFVAEVMQTFYERDRKFTNFLGLFAVVSIIIGCLGLYGLVYFICLRHTKEIGIRKVLGAGITNVVTTLTKGFVRPIIFSIIVALPVAWYLMNLYLNNYAYRIDLSPSIYVIATGLTIVGATIPILFQSLRAAKENPIEALRDE